jgi:hypothetical protein
MKKYIIYLIAGLAFISHSVFSQVIWQQIPFSFPADINIVKVDDNGVLFAGIQDDVYYSDDNGGTWKHCSNWPGYSPKCIGFNSSHHVFIGTYSDGILRSIDGGNTFTEINTGLTFMNVWCVVALDNDEILIGTPGGLFRSVNNGDTWAPYGSGLPGDDIREFSAGDNGKVFAGTLDSGIYRSNDHGANWTEVNNGLPENTFVTSLLALKGNTTVFAGLYPQGLFRSSDDGNTWTENNEGLPYSKLSMPHSDYSIHTIEQFLVYLFLVIYSYAIYYLPVFDFNPQWVMVNNGLPADPHVTCLAPGPGDKIFIGADDQGMFLNAFPVPVPALNSVSSGYSAEAIPNPFHSSVTIRFTIPECGNVSIDIFDIMGRKQTNVADEMFREGTHRVTWTPAGSAGGIYFYRLVKGEKILQGKLVFHP